MISAQSCCSALQFSNKRIRDYFRFDAKNAFFCVRSDPQNADVEQSFSGFYKIKNNLL